MNTLVHADIFFFITAIAAVLITIGVIIALYYIICILRNVKDVTERVDEGTKLLAEDMSVFRSSFKSHGFMWGQLFSFVKKHRRWFTRKARKHGAKVEVEVE